MAHFKKGSIVVEAGDKVSQGQLLGLCGNSGHSTMPHLHFHVQDRKNFWTAVGLPIKFKAIEIKQENGVTEKEESYIESPEVVRNVKP